MGNILPGTPAWRLRQESSDVYDSFRNLSELLTEFRTRLKSYLREYRDRALYFRELGEVVYRCYGQGSALTMTQTEFLHQLELYWRRMSEDAFTALGDVETELLRSEVQYNRIKQLVLMTQTRSNSPVPAERPRRHNWNNYGRH